MISIIINGDVDLHAEYGAGSGTLSAIPVSVVDLDCMSDWTGLSNICSTTQKGVLSRWPRWQANKELSTSGGVYFSIVSQLAPCCAM